MVNEGNQTDIAQKINQGVDSKVNVQSRVLYYKDYIFKNFS